MGFPHPDYLKSKLTKKQLNGWLAFNSLSPIGERRADTRFAILTAHLRNAWVEGEENPLDFRPKFPIYQNDEQPETQEEVAARETREANQFR